MPPMSSAPHIHHFHCIFPITDASIAFAINFLVSSMNFPFLGCGCFNSHTHSIFSTTPTCSFPACMHAECFQESTQLSAHQSLVSLYLDINAHCSSCCCP